MAPTLRRFSHQYHKGFAVTIEEWDICRGADNDLLNEEVQASLLRRVEAGEFCCVILTPPCASWSRAPWANPWGPRPLRTAVHPWGMPWLEGARLQKVADSNSMVRFCILILVAAKGHHPYTAVLVEHPEDLGATRAKPDPHVRPASIWQLPAIRDLVGEGYFTLVLYQCVLGAPSRKPTRLLTSLRGLWVLMDGQSWQANLAFIWGPFQLLAVAAGDTEVSSRNQQRIPLLPRKQQHTPL